MLIEFILRHQWPAKARHMPTIAGEEALNIFADTMLDDYRDA